MNLVKLGYLATGTRLRQITEKLYLDGDRIYKEQNIDFKASWFSVFYTLGNANEPKTVLSLAEDIGFSHITIKNVVRELQSNDLVQVVVHPNDGRSKHISLTEKGKTLLSQLQILWAPFAAALKNLLDQGHPDFMNIINRIEREVNRFPIYQRIKTLDQLPEISILDYKPSLKDHFTALIKPWLAEVINETLEEEDELIVHYPDKAYLLGGGFIFFAMQGDICLGTVALKRLDEHTFEFAKLFVNPENRKSGIATRLIDRCITRCKENQARQLWLQSTLSMASAHTLYYKLGFTDQEAPQQMNVLKRTEKIMSLTL